MFNNRFSVATFPLIFVLAAHWLIVLKPEVSTDGLSMHMAIADNFARHHAFTFDLQHNIWALMPMGADWAYSIVYVLGGEYAARLLNFAMLLAVVHLIFQVCRRFVSTDASLLLCALFASTPLVQLVSGSMYVENFVAAMSLGSFVALLTFRESGSTKHLLLCALLIGTAAGMKLSAIAAVAMVLALLICAAIPRRKFAAIGALVLISIGAIPYALAYSQTGNPIYPYGGEFKDVRFQKPLTVETPVSLTIHTSDYLESQNGAFGFQYLLLAPAALLALLWRRSYEVVAATAIAILAGTIIYLGQPNARYLYIALPFLSIGFSAIVDQAGRAAWFAIALAFAANIYFLPASGWYHRDFYTSPMFAASGRDEYLATEGAVRRVVQYMNEHAGDHPVFYADGSQIAGLAPRAYRNQWHDPDFEKRVEACATARDVNDLLAGLGIEYMIVDREYDKKRQQSVSDLISACSQTEYSLNNFSARKLRPDCSAILK